MKKLISCLLVVVILFSVAGTFAFADSSELNKESNALKAFLNETDLKTQDLVLQSQAGDMSEDLLIHLDTGNLHLVSRTNGVEDSHVQLNPEGIYMGTADAVTLLRYATVTTIMQDITKAVDSMLEKAAQSIPQEKLPSQKEIREAIGKLAILSSAVEAQEQADAVTLNSAAMSFANKFKPEYILDVKEQNGTTQISLRTEAFASAVADAMDELMTNPDLAELVDRQAAVNGGMPFAEVQKEWLVNREATLAALRTIKSDEIIQENGHWMSHFQIGEEQSAIKILVSDMDAWIEAEDGEAEAVFTLAFKDEDPFMVYQFKLSPYSYWEKLSSGESKSEVYYDIEDGRVTSGKVITVVDGHEELMANFDTDYLYVKGPKGGLSASVRETWTGKTRYELVAETVDGQESSFTMDFYEDYDSLVCEMYGKNSESSESVMYKITRIDKVDIDDLSASKNINEITVDKIKAELQSILKIVAPEKMAAAEASK